MSLVLQVLLLGLLPAPARAWPQEPEAADAGATTVSIAEALRSGDLEGARTGLAEAVDALVEPRPGEESQQIDLLLELDRFALELQELPHLLRVRQAIFDLQTRLLPPEHPELFRAMYRLFGVKFDLGDYEGAHELAEDALEACTRLHPADHPDLVVAMDITSLTREVLGDLVGARELRELVLEARLRLLPRDDELLLMTMRELSALRHRLGDDRGAHELNEAVFEAYTRLIPPDQPDHPDLIAARSNLAVTQAMLGDVAGAVGLAEAVLEARTRLLPPDDPDLLYSKQNLAVMRKWLGDLQGARELEAQVLEARMRVLPAGHPDILTAQQNLAVTMRELGNAEAALELEEIVLSGRNALPADHPDLIAVRHNLAATRKQLGDLQGARELEEIVLAARARLFPPDSYELLGLQLNHATTMRALGDAPRARELAEPVLQAWTTLLPADHHALLDATLILAELRRDLGDASGSRELVARLVSGSRARATALREEAPRSAREGARAELMRLSSALSLDASAAPEHALARELFATLEELRLVSVASGEVAQALSERPALASEARAVAELRARLGDLVAAEPQGEEGARSWRTEVLALSEERDRAERSLRRKLAEAGSFVGGIEASVVGAQLGSGAAAVSFLSYVREFPPDPRTGEAGPRQESMLAFVVSREGNVHRLELGAVAELQDLVQDWRASLGKPIERGIAAPDDAQQSEPELGRALRVRVLDPVLAAAGASVDTLHVVLDDFLFLVPLDALPLDGEARVGDRIKLHVEPTLARLLRAEQPVAADGRLVAVGGVDFEAEGTAVAEEQEPSGGAPATIAPVDDFLELASTPPMERSGRPLAFGPLRQTRYEVEDLGAQFEERFKQEPVLLMRTEATKARLRALAPGTRYLHLATHGWFASEAFQSQHDALARAGARAAFERARETLIGFAPETLCGLALSGANRGKDARGRVTGILTAEELATFDLRNCELAVLSACQTNVGIRRAGQGIQSLQTALHAAGARTAITSLWKVDDAATRRLFELFYTNLWQEKLEKHEALWQAKSALRAEGHPPRDWAGWVLSGDPQ